MPVIVRKIGGHFRVVEAHNEKVATNSSGTAVDGGGHDSAEKAEAQARAINASLNKEARK